jgi:hypothetical protein
MAAFSVSYLHDDRLVTRAVREPWWSRARRRELARLALFALAATAFLVAAESLPGATPSTTMRAIMLAPTALVVVWLAVISLVIAVLPRWLARRLRRLPHRTVNALFDDEGIDYATATERYRAAWSEVATLHALESFWLFRLRNGAQLVLPYAAADAGLAAFLAPRSTSNGTR